MEVGRFQAEKARTGRQRPAVSGSGYIVRTSHELMNDAGISSGQWKSFALVPTPPNLHMMSPQERKSEGTYSLDTSECLFVVHAGEIGGDRQCKMENASGQNGVGDEAMAPIAGYLTKSYSFTFPRSLWFSCRGPRPHSSLSCPVLIAHASYGVNSISSSAFPVPLLSSKGPKPIKISSGSYLTALRALNLLASANDVQGGGEPKDAKHVGVWHSLGVVVVARNPCFEACG